MQKIVNGFKKDNRSKQHSLNIIKTKQNKAKQKNHIKCKLLNELTHLKNS